MNQPLITFRGLVNLTNYEAQTFIRERELSSRKLSLPEKWGLLVVKAVCFPLWLVSEVLYLLRK